MWDDEYTEIRIQEAMATLRAQSARGCFPQGHVSNMPDPLRNYWEVWGGLEFWEQQERLKDFNRFHSHATPASISEMDQIIFGLMECFIDPRDRVILTGRNSLDHKGEPRSWRKLSRIDGRSHTWIKDHVYPVALGRFSAYMAKKTLQNSPENATEYARL